MEVLTACSIIGLVSYFVGAIPFGFLVARMRGVDIRKVGSGNIGATNVFRSVGKGWGILTFACDFLKGLLPVLVLPLVVQRYCWPVDAAIPRLVCAGCAIAGHNWTVFLKFRGGKGVATSTGALLGVAWPAVAAGVAVWVVVFGVSRYVSLASLAASAATVIVAWVWLRGPTVVLPVVLTVLGAVTVLRHAANIRRLLNGTEHRAGSARRGVSTHKV